MPSERLLAKGPKTEPLDTILYEIDMLRRAGDAVEQKMATFQKSNTDANRYEYNLSIEGFLLHLRNLLEFLVVPQQNKVRETDLHIDKPIGWAGHSIEKVRYSDLMKDAKNLDDGYGATYGEETYSCREVINKFLAHPTTLRHQLTRKWEIEKIYPDIKAIVAVFEERFVEKTERVMVLMSEDAGSTVSFGRGSPIVVEQK
jgi:hypothetical protein